MYVRAGRTLGTVGQPGNYFGLALSPDDRALVAHRHEGGVGGDLWLIDLTRNTTSRFTFEPAQDNSSPVWAPDERRVAFASLRNGTFGLFVKALDGATPEEQLLHGREHVAPRDWSRDGSTIVYDSIDSGSLIDTYGISRTDIFALPLSADRRPMQLVASRFTEATAALSPDGKWLAYTSDETGRGELYVRPFPTGAGKWQVSTGGGWEPHWRGDSKELFYLDTPQLGSVYAVAVDAAGSSFSAGSPQRLFISNLLTTQHAGPLGHKRFAVSRDGKRFLPHKTREPQRSRSRPRCRLPWSRTGRPLSNNEPGTLARLPADRLPDVSADHAVSRSARAGGCPGPRPFAGFGIGHARLCRSDGRQVSSRGRCRSASNMAIRPDVRADAAHRRRRGPCRSQRRGVRQRGAQRCRRGLRAGARGCRR